MEARHPTVAQRNVQRIAQAALESPEGVTVFFRVKDYESLEACQSLARSFQQTFSSVRHRARRVSAKLLGEDKLAPRDGMAQGIYDPLSCQRLPLPNGEGWSVLLARGNVFLAGFDIIDNATGQPLDTLGREREETQALVEKFLESHNRVRAKGPPLTPHEAARLEELRPGFQAEYLGESPPLPVTIDLVNASDEELGGF